ncbi:hypothetical protein HOLleu_21580 [Holothuria leucospilota]|uniref:Ig-like domain-containing protein n=1 Tax=Holothuria leucospilota TaxID=206669 RepID=A0A9Q1BWL3_HOLLE|nr:hypothetical protein HOLleu_21580 [Holothuria leucospilota]
MCSSLSNCFAAASDTNVTILVNSSYVFNCSVQNLQDSFWLIGRKDGSFEQIAQTGNLFARYNTTYSLAAEDKFGNNETYSFQTLTLFRGTERDEGLYLCKEDKKNRTHINLIVEDPPNCIVTSESTRAGFEVTCHCEANPDSIRYEMYVNGTLYSRKMKDTVSSDKPVTTYCTGTNDVGHSKSKEKTLTPSHGKSKVVFAKI